MPRSTHSSTAAFGSQKRTARSPGRLLHEVLHSTLVYPELSSSVPQQTWLEGQSVRSSQPIDVPPTHETNPEGSHSKLTFPLPFQDPQQTSVFAAHVTFAPPAPVPHAIVLAGGGGGGGGGGPASFVPEPEDPDEVPPDDVLPLDDPLGSRGDGLPLDDPLVPEESALPVPVGSGPACSDAGAEKSSVPLEPLQAASRSIEAEVVTRRRSFIRPQD